MDVEFTVRILKEGDTFVAHVPQLDVSTCGDTEAEARRNASRKFGVDVITRL